MSRKRALIADTFCLKRRRSAADTVAGDSHGKICHLPPHADQKHLPLNRYYK